LICLQFDAMEISTVAAPGDLWKTACVVLEPSGEHAGTNFASLTVTSFGEHRPALMSGFPDEFSDVV
jgi:hypothetical protein